MLWHAMPSGAIQLTWRATQNLLADLIRDTYLVLATWMFNRRAVQALHLRTTRLSRGILDTRLGV